MKASVKQWKFNITQINREMEIKVNNMKYLFLFTIIRHNSYNGIEGSDNMNSGCIILLFLLFCRGDKKEHKSCPHK
jgi:hypothetical protein